MTLSPAKALRVWSVMIGETAATEKQQAFINKIERLYLNFNTAPDSYKEKYPRNHLSEPSVAEAEGNWWQK